MTKAELEKKCRFYEELLTAIHKQSQVTNDDEYGTKKCEALGGISYLSDLEEQQRHLEFYIKYHKE